MLKKVLFLGLLVTCIAGCAMASTVNMDKTADALPDTTINRRISNDPFISSGPIVTGPIVTYATACDSYYWSENGQTYTTSGIYYYHQGITSYQLNLTIKYSTAGTDTVIACNSYTWIDGNTYTTSNSTAKDTLTNAVGCDSVVTLNLTIFQCTTTTYDTACDSYTWGENGATYTTSGLYISNNKALQLTIKHSSASTDVHSACKTYTWIDGNTYTSSNSTASITYTNAEGCDSTVTLNLTVNYTTTGTDVQTACNSYTWIDGNIYTASNSTAKDTLTNASAAGCDSIVTLNLTMKYSNTGSDVQTACDSLTWIDGTTYTASNSTATHTLANANALGCDSVVTLNLTVNYSNTGTDVHTVCDSLTWIDGNTYTASNSTATHTLANANALGCDSTVTLNLTVNYSNTGTDVHTVCDSLTWIDGNSYTASNSTATHTLTNATGCDSVVTLNLTVNYSNTGIDVQTACDTYTWIDGNNYTASNSTATHTLTNAASCDSVVTLSLTVNYSNTGTDVQTACNSYTWIDGNTYTASNSTATHTITNVAGCDSTVTLNLTINHSSASVDIHTVCDSYTWIDGNTYTASNSTATHTLTNAVGCDSLVVLNLTIKQSTTGTDVQTACDTYTWIDGNTYTASNSTATHTLTNAAGCDSVVTLNLTVNYSNSSTDAHTACNSYRWIDGNNYSTSNSTATQTFTNAAGCDSTVTLNLTIRRSSSGVEVITACNRYTWHGNTYTESTNSVTFSTTNAAGCDSTATLDLTINHSSVGTDVQTACNSFTWIDGNTYTTSNSTAMYFLTNAAGCDSVVLLNLTVNHCSTTDTTACDSLQWRGHIYTADGVYAVGTDTIVLTLHHSGHGTETVTACNRYTWHGMTFTASTNTATYRLNTVAGCDSTVTLNLTVNQCSTVEATACDNYTWRGITFTNSGRYINGTDTLLLTLNHSSRSTETATACNSHTWHGTTYTASTNTATYRTTNAVGCDSIVTLHLTVNHCSTTEITACDSYIWLGTTYTTDGIYISGNDTIVLTLNHSSRSTETATACNSYTWHGSTYTTSTDAVTYRLVNAEGCDSIITLHLTVNYDSSEVYTVSDTGSYTWLNHGNSNTYTESGTYTNNYTTADGCNGTDTLHLTIIPYVQYYTVRVAPLDTTMGLVYVVGPSRVQQGESSIVLAIAYEGYRFVRWSDGATANPYTFTVTHDTLIIGIFERAGQGIDETEASDVRVWSNGRTIHAAGLTGEPLRVYDVTGRLVAERTAAHGDMVIPVTHPGLYLVQTGTATHKVLTR